MAIPDIPPERKSLHNAQRSIVAAYAELADMLQLPEKEAKPLPDEEAIIAAQRKSIGAPPPPRATAKNAPAASTGPRSRWWLPAAAVALVAVTIGARFALAPGRELPPQLLGSWSSTNPQFAGREIEFTTDSVMLRNVLALSTRHRIQAVTMAPVEGTTHVKISYEDAGAPQQLEIVLAANGQPEFSLVRPKGVVWRKAGSKS
jgi:hypothetical protein